MPLIPQVGIARRNADNHHFLHFQKGFLPYQEKNCEIQAVQKLSTSAFDLNQPKLLSGGTGLNLSQTTNFRLYQTQRVSRQQF